ncbi:hypothetical protein [Aquisphaera insulae]|uniref:hypothetical protein n=1 Tax=Aquisphaera insulae TaxID=2712864 RepID=UPI0013EBFF04|nr:hypothetical protein [Aquisphaera insulae]
MIRLRTAGASALFLAILALPRVPSLGQEAAVPIEPADLGRRADLVGKLISVDDRVKHYIMTPSGPFDELHLKRTNVVLRLRGPQRPRSQPRPMPVIAVGRLAREGDQLVMDVSSLAVQLSDLERLEKGVSALPPGDFENRKAWAAWAEKRGAEFKDAALSEKARGVLTEALRLEADGRRGTVDAPREWLAMAEEARRRGVKEPEPSALAHRAFRAQLAEANGLKSLEALQKSVERFFPNAASDVDSGRLNLARWDEPYRNDPAGAYRMAAADQRKGLDRRLWGDVEQKILEAKAAADPISAIELATEAERRLPERKDPLANRLLAQGLGVARQNLGTLRKDEARSMAAIYRDRLNDPRAAQELLRAWLRIRRDRLSETDADGPVELASLYEEMLQDRTAAKELLDRAWKIAPGTNAIAEAFRTRGYRLDKDQWVELSATAPTENPSPNPAPAAGLGGGLRGKSTDEVLRQIGSKPDSKVLCGTRGQVVEQWIFHLPGQNKDRYVNFLRSAGDLRPHVISDYTLPRPAVGMRK